MRKHRNPKTSVSKQAPPDNFNPRDAWKLALDSTVLETLLEHAASAARLVGHIDEGVNGTLPLGQLADEIDAIVHQLSELLGNPHWVAVPASSTSLTVVPDVVSHDRAIAQDEASRALTTPNANCIHSPLAGGATDVGMRPHRQAGGPRTMSSQNNGASRWWRRVAALAGMIVLTELMFRVLGSCGGAR